MDLLLHDRETVDRPPGPGAEDAAADKKEEHHGTGNAPDDPAVEHDPAYQDKDAEHKHGPDREIEIAMDRPHGDHNQTETPGHHKADQNKRKHHDVQDQIERVFGLFFRRGVHVVLRPIIPG